MIFRAIIYFSRLNGQLSVIILTGRRRRIDIQFREPKSEGFIWKITTLKY